MSLWRFIIALCATIPAFLGGVYAVGRMRSVFVGQLVRPSVEEGLVLLALGGFLFAWLALWLVTRSRPATGPYLLGGVIWTTLLYAIYKS